MSLTENGSLPIYKCDFQLTTKSFLKINKRSKNLPSFKSKKLRRKNVKIINDPAEGLIDKIGTNNYRNQEHKYATHRTLAEDLIFENFS